MMGGRTEHLFMGTHDHKKFPFLVSGQQTSRTVAQDGGHHADLLSRMETPEGTHERRSRRSVMGQLQGVQECLQWLQDSIRPVPSKIINSLIADNNVGIMYGNGVAAEVHLENTIVDGASRDWRLPFKQGLFFGGIGIKHSSNRWAESKERSMAFTNTTFQKKIFVAV
mmetsp:Transcript_24626/g.37435  ORF Transcript_24626/g.37435 Transcript_24626/m.37435 type:complete len:168 (-) Transcript_24626:168-671(-)